MLSPSSESNFPFDNDWEEHLQELGLHYQSSAPLTTIDVQLKQDRTDSHPSEESNFLFDNNWDELLQELSLFRDPNAQNVVPLNSTSFWEYNRINGYSYLDEDSEED